MRPLGLHRGLSGGAAIPMDARIESGYDGRRASVSKGKLLDYLTLAVALPISSVGKEIDEWLTNPAAKV